MKELYSCAPDLPTKEAMSTVTQAFCAVADVTTIQNVISLQVHRSLQYWLQSFDPNQKLCFLTEPYRVYSAAIETLDVFMEEIGANTNMIVRQEIMRQVSRLFCLREATLR